jgi:hypothetical protein
MVAHGGLFLREIMSYRLLRLGSNDCCPCALAGLHDTMSQLCPTPAARGQPRCIPHRYSTLIHHAPCTCGLYQRRIPCSIERLGSGEGGEKSCTRGEGRRILSSSCILCRIKEIRHARRRGFASSILNLGKNCAFVSCLILVAAPIYRTKKGCKPLVSSVPRTRQMGRSGPSSISKLWRCSIS